MQKNIQQAQQPVQQPAQPAIPDSIRAMLPDSVKAKLDSLQAVNDSINKSMANAENKKDLRKTCSISTRPAMCSTSAVCPVRLKWVTCA